MPLFLIGNIVAQPNFSEIEKDLQGYKKYGNKYQLIAAKEVLDEIIFHEEYKSEFKTWELRAEVYGLLYKDDSLRDLYDKFDLLDRQLNSIREGYLVFEDKRSLRAKDLYASMNPMGLVFYDRAMNEFANRNYGEAYRYYTGVIKAHSFLKVWGRDKDKPLWLIEYRDTAMLNGGESAYKADKFDLAVPLLEEAVKVDPNPYHYGLLINSYKETGQLKKVSRLKWKPRYILMRLKNGVSKGRNNPELAYNKARGYHLEGDYAMAKQYYGITLQSDTNHIMASYQLARLYHNEAERIQIELQSKSMTGASSAQDLRRLRLQKQDLLNKAANIYLELMQREDPAMDPEDLRFRYSQARDLSLK